MAAWSPRVITSTLEPCKQTPSLAKLWRRVLGLCFWTVPCTPGTLEHLVLPPQLGWSHQPAGIEQPQTLGWCLPHWGARGLDGAEGAEGLCPPHPWCNTSPAPPPHRAAGTRSR